MHDQNLSQEFSSMLNHRMGIRAEKIMEMPIGLKHFESEFCWCDPIVEMDEDGREVVVH